MIVRITPVTVLYQGVSSRLDDGPQWMIKMDVGSKMMESMYITIASASSVPLPSKSMSPEKKIQAVTGSRNISAMPGFFQVRIRNPKKTTI